jgi:cell shape-determining protein MreC
MDNSAKDAADKLKKGGEKNIQELKRVKEENTVLKNQMELKNAEQNQSLTTIKTLKTSNQ